MENSDIKIDKEGIWFYRGAQMFRKDILSMFFEHLKIDEFGKYFVELDKEVSYLDVEDTAFVVTSTLKQKLDGDTAHHIYIQLSDDSWEKLDLCTLSMNKENIPYCTVKNGKFAARFSRKGYYQLAVFIEHEEKENRFFINFNNEIYFINNNVS